MILNLWKTKSWAFKWSEKLMCINCILTSKSEKDTDKYVAGIIVSIHLFWWWWLLLDYAGCLREYVESFLEAAI